MSEIKVNSIKGVSASVAALSINNTDGTCTANITNNLSNRRLTINGAMTIAQRGVSSTTSGYGSVDRFGLFYGGTDEAPTQEQVAVASGTTPYTLGFRKAFKVTNGNQTSGAGTTDYIRISHRIEAGNMATSGWNYTDPNSKITLSFWVKSSVAQSFKHFLLSRDGTILNYPFETGSLSANTWTKVTKTIPGHASLQFDTDTEANTNYRGLDIVFALFYGTNYTSSVTENEWNTNTGQNHMADNTSTWYTTNDATFEITGVQLEVGSVATDFEHRSFGQELALCQRYFYALNNGGTVNRWFFPIEATASHRRLTIDFPTTMRAAPTVENFTGGDGESLSGNYGSQRMDPDSGTLYWDASGASGLRSLGSCSFQAEL